MEITGRIIQDLGERGGTSARTGTEWKVATYVLETIEQYPHKVCFEVFGTDRIAQLKAAGLALGADMTISIDIDAHEYNGRWYNSIRAFRAIPAANAAAPVPPPSANPTANIPPFGGAEQQAGAAPVGGESFGAASDDTLPF